MSKKVCMIVAYHPFLDARIFEKEAKSLQKKGYNVTMIVPRKNGYLFHIDGTPYKRSFRNKVFTHEGIKIVTYKYESCIHQLNTVLRDEKFWETEGFTNPLTELAIKQNADIYHAHEYLSLFAGIGIKRLMKKRKGKQVKLIYDSHELTPDPLDPRYSQEMRETLLQKLFSMLDEVDYIITVSDAIKLWYEKNKPNVPVEVIYNAPPLTKNYVPKQYRTNDVTVGHVGSFDDKNVGWNKVIGITERCAKKVSFTFKVIGGNRFGQSVVVPKHLQHNIRLSGWVEYKSIPTHLKDVYIGWIDFENVNESLNKNYALPNRFFSYLNNGIPIIVNNCAEMARFIRTYQCGIVVNKKNVTSKEYAEALLHLMKDKRKLTQMSKNARNIMEKLYCWEKMESRLYNVYEQLLT